MPHDASAAGHSLTWAFLACGCRTVYDGHDRDIGDVVVCPNLATCDRHHGGWTTITETLAGTLTPAAA